MNEVAVIRRCADDYTPVVEAIRAAFPMTIDVHRWEHVRIERVDSNGQVTAYVGDAPLDELRAVFHLGSPAFALPTPTADQSYVAMERDQSMLAALAACRHIKIVNRGAVLAGNRGVLEPSGQLRILARIGWATPSVTHSFDLDGNVATKLRDPEPEAEAQDLLVIGLRRHVRRGSAPAPALDPLIAKTQLYMRDAQLDVCTIPIALTRSGPVAFGIHPGVSTDVPRAGLTEILLEAVG